MNLFWCVPIPFAITYLSGGLICEHIQKRKEEALESLDDTLNKFEKQKPDGYPSGFCFIFYLYLSVYPP